jgi:hypothetical protein
VFTHSEISNDREQIQKNFGSLRDYVKKFISPAQAAREAADKKIQAAAAKNAAKNAPAAVAEKK